MAVFINGIIIAWPGDSCKGAFQAETHRKMHKFTGENSKKEGRKAKNRNCPAVIFYDFINSLSAVQKQEVKNNFVKKY